MSLFHVTYNTNTRAVLSHACTFINNIENQLAHLRKENRKTTLTAILIFIVLVLFYVFIMSPLKQKNEKSEH